MGARTLAVVATFLFSSGLCALVYQSVWLRTFRLIFGASTPSSAAVLAIFMGGLGAGGAWLGRRVERSRFPLVTYGNLEIGVALSAAATPFLLDAAAAAYVAVGGTPVLGSFGATCARLLLALVVLGVPVFLMGGTLPAAARVVTDTGDGQRRALATLYGVNTLGAVAGSLLATFTLLEIYGARTTLWLAALVNLAIGVLARSRGRGYERLPHIDEGVSARMRTRRWPVLGAAFITGFVFLLAELVWYRMAAPILGGSTYGFGLVLACALGGVGLGGALYAALPPRMPSVSAFAATCALEALCLLAPFAWGDDLALLAHHLRAWGAWSFPQLVFGWGVVMAVIALPASIVAGYQFPLLLALKGSADVEVGRDSGELYAANTLGSIVGSLAGGFGVLPLLGAPNAWRFASIALAVVAVAALVFAAREPRADGQGRSRAALVVSVLCLVLLVPVALARGPGLIWRHTAIGAGRAEVALGSENDRIRLERELARAVVHELDGVESSLAFQGGFGWSLIQNGKSDGNTYADANTQIGLALLPAVLHDDVKRAFVIGLGTGQSAGWLAQVPSVERVDVAEIEPGVLAFAERVADTSFDVVKSPKVHIEIGDGRELLALAPARYDLIVSEPSNPYRAGVSSFFSTELYQAAAERLTPTGVFSQWVQGYEIDVTGLEVIIATMATAFPHITVWEMGTADLLFLASREPQSVDVDRLRARLAVAPFSTWTRRVLGVDGAEGVLALHRAGARTTRAVASAHADAIHTDDMPILEFSFARSVGTTRRPAREILRDAALHVGDARASVRGAVDWARVEREASRLHVWTTHHDANGIPPPLSDALHAYASQQWRAAHDAFLASPHVLDANERLLHAHTMSELSAAEAPREALEALLVQAERDGFALDAAWVRLNAAITDSVDAPEADAATWSARIDELLEKAVVLARQDPWPMQRIAPAALAAVGTLGGSERRVQALSVPFAGAVLDRLRVDVAQQIDRALGVRPACVTAAVLSEPATTWDGPDLSWRARCYEAAGDARAQLAAEELATFLEHDARTQLVLDPGGAPAGP